MAKAKILIMIVVLCLFASTIVYAVNVNDITNVLESNYNSINDYTADMTCDSTNNNHDITNSESYYKKAASSKFRMDIHSPLEGILKCDGTNVKYENGDQWTKTDYVTNNNPVSGWISKMTRETDILWILDNNNFTLTDGIVAVNGVTCRKITSTDYDIYVDDSSYATVIRIDRKESASVKRRYTFSDHSLLESTAYMWAICEATDSLGDNTESYCITLSNVSINDGLSDSWFDID